MYNTMPKYLVFNVMVLSKCDNWFHQGRYTNITSHSCTFHRQLPECNTPVLTTTHFPIYSWRNKQHLLLTLRAVYLDDRIYSHPLLLWSLVAAGLVEGSSFAVSDNRCCCTTLHHCHRHAGLCSLMLQSLKQTALTWVGSVAERERRDGERNREREREIMCVYI